MAIDAKVKLSVGEIEITLPSGKVIRKTVEGKAETVICMKDRFVVLLREVTEKNYSKNLQCYSYDGELLWICDAPTDEDTWMDIYEHQGKIMAGSWGTYSCEINPSSGACLNGVYTK